MNPTTTLSSVEQEVVNDLHGDLVNVNPTTTLSSVEQRTYHRMTCAIEE